MVKLPAMSSSQGIAPALAALAGILEREKGRGLETVPFAPESESLLRELPVVLGRKPVPKPAAIVSSGAGEAPPSAPAAPPAVEVAPSAPPPPPPPPQSEADRRQALNAIFKQVKSAPEPRALGTLFDTVVFAVGNPMAEIVLVGEAPGAEEERQKKPFVGPAGQKLDQILKAMGLAREQVYISNIVKFRPKIGDGRFQGSRNRPPNQDEMTACLPYVRAEIELLRPRVVVALGRTAAEGLLERGGSIASFRNLDHEFSGIPVVVTYHPSYLLRQEAASPQEGKQAKRLVWEDMLRVMDYAGLPISEKQRKYFL